MTTQTNTQIPQGFSVFQPMLGAPLQFFPALGTKELDEMMDAYVVGPVSVKEKRATVSVDFLEYAQRTGQTFKFYAVPGMMAPVESPVMASPLQASTSASSINASPVASNWDWSAVNAPTPSARPAKASRTESTASSRRSAPADFSHIPGMKILTKDGLDVTNSASRGSKTKEQRDHAHLMRIIKACDACKKKKIRCDPSHKKRSTAPQPAKVTKKQPRATQPTVATPQPDSFSETPSIDFDSSFTPPEFEHLDIDNLMKEPWEDLIQYPAAEEDPNYDFFLDPQGFFSQPLGQQAISSTSNSPFSWSDEQFNAYTSSSDLNDYGLIQSTSASTSPSTLDLDLSSLPPDLPQSHVPLNPSDQQYAQTQQSVAMPDLYQPALVGGFGQERYATSQSQFPADGAASRSSSSTENSQAMLASPLGSATSSSSSPVEGMMNSFSASPQEISSALRDRSRLPVASLADSAVLQLQGGDLSSQPMSRSTDLDNTPGADSSGSGILASRGLAHIDESSIRRSSAAPISARMSSQEDDLSHSDVQQVRVTDGRFVDSSATADTRPIRTTDGRFVDSSAIANYVSDEPITGTDCAHEAQTGVVAPRTEPATGTDCARNAYVDVVAPRMEPATGTDCSRGRLQLPLQTIQNVAGPSTSAAPLQLRTGGLQTEGIPRLGSLAGQTSSSLVLASATLYGALDMLLAKQQKNSVLDKGRRKSFTDSGSSWLGMCGKLAIIPLATVLATGFLPGWSFVG